MSEKETKELTYDEHRTLAKKAFAARNRTSYEYHLGEAVKIKNNKINKEREENEQIHRD